MSAPSTDSHAFHTATGGSLSPADRFATQAEDALLLVARVLLAYIFIKSGFGKLMDLGGFSAMLASRGLPMAPELGVVGACVEFFGGVAILVGFKARYTAVLMAIFVVVATAISHRYWDFPEAARRAQEINFEKNVCIIGGFALLIVTGAGRFSIDGRRR